MSSAVFFAPDFRMMFARCALTVRGLMPGLAPISFGELPRRISSFFSRSLPDSFPYRFDMSVSALSNMPGVLARRHHSSEKERSMNSFPRARVSRQLRMPSGPASFQHVSRCAGLQSPDEIGNPGPAAENHHTGIFQTPPYFPGQADAVRVGQFRIENDNIRLRLFCKPADPACLCRLRL